MNVELIIDENRLLEIIPDWEKLVSGFYISMSPNWLVNWWLCYKEERFKLHIYAVWSNKELRVLFPLMLESTDNDTTLRFLSNNCSDYLSIAYKEGDTSGVDIIIDQIATSDEWTKLVLENLSCIDPNVEYLYKKLIEYNFELICKKHDDTAELQIEKPWDEFILSRSHNVRHSYRKINKLQLDFVFKVFTEYDRLTIEKIFELHIARWRDVNHASAYADVRRKLFLHNIAQAFAKDNKMILFALYKDEKMVAYRFGFIDGKIYYDWNTSFAPEFEQYSCGKLLLSKIYTYCYENKITKLDFMKGYEHYKEALKTKKGFVYSIECMNKQKLKNYSPPKEKIKKIINKVKGIIFDLDGVVYSGDAPIIDTIDTINQLIQLDIKVGFLTNTSAKTISEIQYKLEKMGVNVDSVFIMTSSIAVGKYLSKEQCKSCVIFGGGNSLFNEIKKYDIQVYSGRNISLSIVPSFLVIGYTTDFNYDDFLFCTELINKGARLICTDKDNRFAHNGGWLPGTGWIVASLEYVTSQKAIIIGKPKKISISYLMDEMKMMKEDLLMVGDNLDTDIMVAKEVGIPSCLFLGGVSGYNDIARSPNYKKPDMVFDNLRGLLKYFLED